MRVGGLGRKRILVLAEAPGGDEDIAYAEEIRRAEQEGRQPVGKQLIGKAGRTLLKALSKHGISLHRDCWTYNAVNCRPPKNRTPTSAEIAACRPNVLDAIKTLQPRFILALGNVAVESLLAHRWFDMEAGIGGIFRWRGWQAPDMDLGAWVCPVFHPSFVMRASEDSDPQIPLWFDIDLERFASLVHNEPEWPTRPTPDSVEILSDREAAKLLRSILDGSTGNEQLAFDYETTGLKPATAEHQIACVGLASSKWAVAFMLSQIVTPLWRKFLESNVPKIAHNAPFEERWGRRTLGTRANNWAWDTMLAAHALDNRTKISGLKFQTYVKLGIADYSSSINPYLRAEGSLGVNEVMSAPREKLLRYCGMDAQCTAILARHQQQEFVLAEMPTEGMELLLEGMQTLCDDEENGVVLDTAYIEQQRKRLKQRIAAVESRISVREDGVWWNRKYGTKTNYGSTQQLAAVILENHPGLQLPTTAKGNVKVDESALQEVADQVPLVQDILEIRKIKKISDTYLAGWQSEVEPDGIIRAFARLNTVRTFRSSFSNPNLQNVPIRDKLAQRMCRRAIFPRKGHHFVEIDYSGIEVRVGACYHKDPQMLKYIMDKSTDMHRDMAMECFKLGLDEVSKAARQGAKNQFVFPEFYGSYWANTGAGLWKWAHDCETAQGVSLVKHLKKHGLRTQEAFLRHIRKVEDRFWGERFKGYADWKDEWWRRYLRTGHFDTLTGFRCQGPMRKNEVVNYPIQGSAFHCLLKAKGLTRKWIEENGSGVLPCGQVHDSGLFSVPPEELEVFCRETHRLWCDVLREIWPWIIVPLEIEIDVAPVGRSWYEKAEYKL